MRRNSFLRYWKRHKAIAILLLAVLVLGGSLTVAAFVKASKKTQDESLDFARTVILEKTSLNDSVMVSGTVESSEVSSVTSALANVKVTEVRVKVGDLVKKGDVICTLDSTDITKEIAEKKKTLSEETKNLQTAYDKAVKQLDEAKIAREAERANQDRLVNAAQQQANSANNIQNAAAPAYNAAKKNYDTMMQAVTPYLQARDAADAAQQNAYNAWIAAGGQPSGAEYDAYQAAQTEQAARQKALADAQTLYSYAEYEKTWKDVQADYAAKSTAAQTARAAYDEAAAGRTKTMDALDANVSTLLEAVATAGANLKKGPAGDLEELNKKLADTVLKAETAGKVTELKVNVGGLIKDTVATIQSTDRLVLSVKVPEYDINRIAVGMKANITSDAATKPITGTVSRISPTAATGEASGFSADIMVDQPDGLFIGTKAKAEIVVSSKTDVFAVPLDAIKTDDAGQSAICVKQKDGTFSDLPVTTGSKNDYYIEITAAELKAGMEILADASWSDLAQNTATQIDAMEQM